MWPSESVDAFEAHVVARRNQGCLLRRIVDRRLDQVKFTAPSLCRIKNRSWPSMIACSTEYSIPSWRGSTEVNGAFGSEASAMSTSEVIAEPAAMTT